MKRLFLIIACLLLPFCASSQYLAKVFTTSTTEKAAANTLDVVVANADSIVLLQNPPIASGVFVSGQTTLANDDDSYVRVILRDKYDIEYLVYELYPLLAESPQSSFSKVGLETAYLDNVQPKSIRIEAHNATIALDSVLYVMPQGSQRSMREAVSNRKSQCEYVAEALNDKLIRENKTWRAGVTFVSQLTYEEKKGLFGKDVPELYGFDYYKGGVFVMPGYESSLSSSYSETDTASPYVTEWDWRNRHGKNWMTSVKNQGSCRSCSAFSALGTFESYINLYYNQLVDYDLSEQDLITDGPVDCGNGAYLPDVLNRLISSKGVVPEECFPYSATNDYGFNKCNEPLDILHIEGYLGDYSDSYRNNHSTLYIEEEDSVKRMLFRSPLCFGIRPWLHFVVLAGFKQIHSGENYFTSSHNFDTICISPDNPLIGHPAWLIKNSIGTDWGDNGFGYIAISLPDAYGIYKLAGKVESQIFSDYDIVCEDADGDGYYTWGIKDSTFTLPIWAPTEEDGDDSDYTKGPIDEFGNLQEIDPNMLDTIFIDTNTDYDTPQYVCQHIRVYEGWDFTISNHVYCNHGVTITLERDSHLYVEGGGVLENVILKPEPGSHIIIDNGSIKHNKNVNFKIPIGVTLEQNHGTIK